MAVDDIDLAALEHAIDGRAMPLPGAAASGVVDGSVHARHGHELAGDA